MKRHVAERGERMPGTRPHFVRPRSRRPRRFFAFFRDRASIARRFGVCIGQRHTAEPEVTPMRPRAFVHLKLVLAVVAALAGGPAVASAESAVIESWVRAPGNA